MADTDIFLTHLHSDHAGLAPEFLAPTSRIFVSATDRAGLPGPACTGRWEDFDDLFLAKRLSAAAAEGAGAVQPGRSLSPAPCGRYEAVADGDRFSYGGYTSRPSSPPATPRGTWCCGRRPTVSCSWGTTSSSTSPPNITVWPSYANPLGGYLDSLALVRRLPVRLPLPAHRTVQTGLRERIDEITAHHSRRCGEVLTVLSATPASPPTTSPPG